MKNWSSKSYYVTKPGCPWLKLSMEYAMSIFRAITQNPENYEGWKLAIVDEVHPQESNGGEAIDFA